MAKMQNGIEYQFWVPSPWPSISIMVLLSAFKRNVKYKPYSCWFEWERPAGLSLQLLPPASWVSVWKTEVGRGPGWNKINAQPSLMSSLWLLDPKRMSQSGRMNLDAPVHSQSTRPVSSIVSHAGEPSAVRHCTVWTEQFLEMMPSGSRKVRFGMLTLTWLVLEYHLGFILWQDMCFWSISTVGTAENSVSHLSEFYVNDQTGGRHDLPAQRHGWDYYRCCRDL